MGKMFSGLFLMPIAYIFIGCSNAEYTEKMEKDINKKVIDDSIRQYDIAKRSGNQIDVCVQAGGVKAALLQAKDEASYKIWNDVERRECEAVK